MMSGQTKLIWLCIVILWTGQSASAAGTCRRKEAPVISTEDIGGKGGGAFTDASLHLNNKVTALEMTCGRVLVSLRLKYGNKWGPVRGGGISRWCEFPAKEKITVNLDCDEYIVAAVATSNGYINSIQFETNKRLIKKCGTTTGKNRFDLVGRELVYISGRKGCYVDRLRLHWAL